MHADTFLLFPGAGTDCNQHTLVALDEGLCGLAVARRDFPYRQTRKGPPDRAPKLIQAVSDEAAALRDSGSEQILLGGRSMGGRMCSMAVAQGLAASGLVLLSYPLHPPGKPDKLRVEHFGDLNVPCLFISGTRDPFGTPDELIEASQDIPGDVRIEWLEGKGHDPKGCDEIIVEIVRDWLESRR